MSTMSTQDFLLSRIMDALVVCRKKTNSAIISEGRHCAQREFFEAVENILRDHTKTIALNRARAERGPEIAEAYGKVLLKFPDCAFFEYQDILQQTLAELDKQNAQSGKIQLGFLTRTNS